MEFILSRQKCEACSAKALPASDDEIASLSAQIPEWEICENEGVRQLFF